MSTKKIPKRKSSKKRRKVPPYPFEFRLGVARLHVEDGYPVLVLAQEFDISESSVYVTFYSFGYQPVKCTDQTWLAI